MEPLVYVLVGLTAILVVCLNVVVFLCYRSLVRRISADFGKLADKVSSSVDAGAKINEVRDFFEYANPELQKLLNEAHRDGDRQKQNRFRGLIERMNTLKARTVDRSAKLLDPNADTSSRRKRRRRPRRRSPNGQGRPGNDSSKGGKNGGGGDNKPKQP